MSKRTLADELRSVLLAHSMDAPEPDATMERILAGTVAQVNRVELPVAAKRRWRPSAQLLGAAAVIMLVVLGAAGINALRNNGSQQSSSKNSAAQPAAGDRAAPQLSSGQASLGSQPRRPNAAPGFAANPPAPADLGCSSIPDGQVVVGAHTTFTLTSTGQQLSVYEFYCVGSNGQRTGSEVQVFDVVAGKLSLLSTLVPASKEGHVDYLSAIPNGVRVQGTDNSDSARPGDLVSISFTTTDGKHFASTGTTVAKACQRSDLTVELATVPGGVVGAHQVLRLTNHTVFPCALEGFPKLTATLDGRPLGSASPSLSGPSGGVTQARVPPIVNLVPGGTAGAIIEFATPHPGCAPGNAVSITLPTGVSLGSLPAALSTCGLFVHPLVANADGLN